MSTFITKAFLEEPKLRSPGYRMVSSRHSRAFCPLRDLIRLVIVGASCFSQPMRFIQSSGISVSLVSTSYDRFASLWCFSMVLIFVVMFFDISRWF